MSANNDRLPFDVLGSIFQCLVETKDQEDSLDTLLLVCRSWNDAVLGHPRLWSQINTIIRSDDAFSTHRAYVLSRLRRNGATLLDITILVDIPNDVAGKLHEHYRESECMTNPGLKVCCRHQTIHLTRQLLHILEGEDGAGCTRWRTLNLDLAMYRDTTLGLYSTVELGALTYSMPSLVSVKLSRMRITTEILPSCPALQSIHFDRARISILPDLSSATEITYSVRSRFNDWILSEQSLFGFAKARNLQKLTLDLDLTYSDLRFPDAFSQITHLSFMGCCPSLLELQFPSLRSISMSFRMPSQIDEIRECEGISWSYITQLDISSLPTEWDEGYEVGYRRGLSALLSKAESIGYIKADYYFTSVILKLIWDSLHATSPMGRVALLCDKRVVLHALGDISRTNFGGLVSRQVDAISLYSVMNSLGSFVPDINWDKLRDMLGVCLFEFEITSS